jgi:ATP-dependent Clp protease protease subunit
MTFNKEQAQNEGVFAFVDAVSPPSCKLAIEWILNHNTMPEEEKKKQLTLMICSGGGDGRSMFALIDIMKGSRIPVFTVGLGCIASAGLMIFMAGAKGGRILTPSTMILTHQYSAGHWGKEHELKAAQESYDQFSNNMIKHYMKCTGLTKSQVRDILLPPTDKWLTPREAIKWGIADKVKEMY